jgi:hypothetical protein
MLKEEDYFVIKKSLLYVISEFGLSPVTLPSCAMTTFRLKIKKFKKIKNRTLKAVIWTAPSPVQYGHEGIHSHLQDYNYKFARSSLI